MQRLALVFACLLMFTGVVRAQNSGEIQAGSVSQLDELQRQLDELKREYEERISTLEIKIAELSAGSKADEGVVETPQLEGTIVESDEADEPFDESAPESTTYSAGSLSLQELNPEISVVGDFVSWYGDSEGDNRHSNSDLRVLGVHLESYLDPYSRFKACVPVTSDWARLGEAYMTRYDVGRNLNLTLGKFNQEFGVVNRWHEPGLDQVDYPLALRQIFGGNLNQTGISLDWLLPGSGSVSQDMTLQITNGQNPRLFGGNTHNLPSALMHYKNYRDLSKDKYLEIGLTALAGRNDEWEIQPPGGSLIAQDRNLWTWVLGADLTLLWEPTEAMRYHNWVWRTEAYYLRKNILAPDGSGSDSINAWGAYSYFQRMTSRTVEVGLRCDYYKPDVKGYAELADLSLSPLAVNTPGARQWQVSPYVTWWQSPWVRWRLEYDHMDGKGLPDDDRLWLQCTFSAGPHKHERY